MPTREEIKNFSMLIERMVIEKRLGLMDAICQHCKDTGLEIEVAATLVSSALKAKLKEEAQELNLLKKSSRLPI